MPAATGLTKRWFATITWLPAAARKICPPSIRLWSLSSLNTKLRKLNNVRALSPPESDFLCKKRKRDQYGHDRTGLSFFFCQNNLARRTLTPPALRLCL